MEKNRKNKSSVKKKQETATVYIDNLGGEGVGVGKHNGKAVLVPFVLPGEKVLVRITDEKSSFCRGEVKKIIEVSNERTVPFCKYFSVCGGCAFQHTNYENEIKHKHSILKNIFRSFRNIEIASPMPSENRFGYRAKLQLQCENKGKRLVAGFYKQRTRHIIEIDECKLHSDSVNSLARDVVYMLNEKSVSAYRRENQAGFIRDIVIRESKSTGDLLLTLVINRDTLKERNALSKSLFSKHPKLKGFFLYTNKAKTEAVFRDGSNARGYHHNSPLTKVYGTYITDSLANCNFTISPVSFFQVNPSQASNILSFLEENFAKKASKKDILFDAYAGVGAFSIPFAQYFSKVFAVEASAAAVDIGKENSRQNSSKTVRFFASDAEKFVVNEGAVENVFLLLDPPRAGLTKSFALHIAENPFKKIAYVSCNAHTLSRDLEIILSKGRYSLKSINSFDMFPATHHIESVAILDRI